MIARFFFIVFFALVLNSPALAQTQAERGQYLAVLGDCAGCHSTPHGPAFTGGLPFSAPFGTLYSTNITPDKATGLGNWSQDDFYRALHDAIAPGGKHLYPAFPYIYFTHLTRADTDALFAYLRTLTPAYAPPRPDALHFPFNIGAVMIVWNWLYLDKSLFQSDPAKSTAWNRGNYLVTGLGHCAACHTPKNLMFGDENDRALSGGVLDNWYAANLTGGQVDGLGKWSQSDLVQYLATGRNKFATAAGSMQEKVTSSTSHMTDADRAAIATYLKSLTPYKLVTPKAPDPDQMRRGQARFVANCAVCHQDQAASLGPLADYPQLAGDTLVLGRDPTTVMRVILAGAESPVTPHAHTTFSMPSFAAMPDQDIADVATYIRNSWGNQAPPVTTDQASRLRTAIAATPF